MIKKISIILLVSAILVAGYISIKKLNFLERSINIFKFSSASQSFEGRGGRGTFSEERQEGFIPRSEFGTGNQRPDRMNIPDSLRRRFESRDQRVPGRRRNLPDSLVRSRIEGDATLSGRAAFDDRIREFDGHGGRDGRGGSTISLRNVVYFLGVFAFFTVIIIYIEKAYCLIFKKKYRNTETNEDCDQLD